MAFLWRADSGPLYTHALTLVYILTDFKNATVTSLYISQNTVVCKIPLL